MKTRKQRKRGKQRKPARRRGARSLLLVLCGGLLAGGLLGGGQAFGADRPAPRRQLDSPTPLPHRAMLGERQDRAE